MPQLDPKLATALVHRAWVGARCPDKKYRDGKKAVELATKACEIAGWKDPEALGILSVAYSETVTSMRPRSGGPRPPT